MVGRFPQLAATPFYVFGDYGYLGVQIFFVISGYCIASAAVGALTRGSGVGPFLLARCRRVFPPAWISLLLVAAFSMGATLLVASGRLHSSTLAGQDLLHRSLLFYVSNLTLTQIVSHQPFLSIVCWTLCYEAAFYLIVGLFLLRPVSAGDPRRLLNGLHLLTVLTMAVLIAAPRLRCYPLDLWPQFGLGALVYDALHHAGERRPRLWLAVVTAQVAAFVALHSIPMSILGEPSRLTFSVSLAFALLLIVAYRHDARLQAVRAVQVLSLVGIFSYSLYLTHFLTLGLVNQAARLAHLPVAMHLALSLVAVAASVVVGLAFYQFFERPFINSGHSFGFRPSRPVPAVIHTEELLVTADSRGTP